MTSRYKLQAVVATFTSIAVFGMDAPNGNIEFFIGFVFSLCALVVFLYWLSVTPPLIKHINTKVEDCAPPIWPTFLVRWVKSSDETEVIIGDLDEEFFSDARRFSLRFAKLVYIKECIVLFYEGTKSWLLAQIPFVKTAMTLLEKLRRS